MVAAKPLWFGIADALEGKIETICIKNDTFGYIEGQYHHGDLGATKLLKL